MYKYCALMKAERMQTEGKRDGATMGEISSAIDLARDAIAKATGKQEQPS